MEAKDRQPRIASEPAGAVLAEETGAPAAVIALPVGVWIAAAVVWAALLTVALHYDGPVATAVHDRGIASAVRSSRWSTLWKLPGTFGFTIAVVVVGMAARRLDGRNAIFVSVSGALAGINIVPKWMVGRIRPYKLAPYTMAKPFTLQPFCDGIHGFFYQVDLSFPSGHECSAWALAAAIAVLYPRASIIFFAFAVVVGVERVIENAHYCSDVVAAVPVATFGCWLAWRLVRPTTPLDRLVV
jgi:membrane-associated phospholipid phosphatase